jgi:hypothetical protein
MLAAGADTSSASSQPAMLTMDTHPNLAQQLASARLATAQYATGLYSSTNPLVAPFKRRLSSRR